MRDFFIAVYLTITFAYCVTDYKLIFMLAECNFHSQ